MTADEWHERCAVETCPFCAQLKEPDKEDAYGFPVMELASGRLRLSRNQTRTGYCILIHHEHVLELHELEPEQLEAFIQDVAAVSRAIQGLRGAAKMNVQFLGNGVPHLHAHIFPRYLGDGDFGRYPEDKTTAYSELATGEVEALLAELRSTL